MPDREKLIRALTFCCYDIHDGDCYPDCPYYDACSAGSPVPAVMYDVLALLKEQEARMLYSVEIKLDTVYWMEQKDVNQPWPVAFIRLRGNPDKLVYEDYYGDQWSISGYCVGEKGWRCWTAKPTDEQRKAVKWGE